MTNDGWLWCSDQRIPSQRDASHRLLEDVTSRLRGLDWPQPEIYGVQLALEEALANAIRHGNGLDPSKQIRVRCKLSDRRICVEVADEGAGFVPHQVPDPTVAENLEKPHGRGILLMRSYMTRVEYNAAGNVVMLEKERIAGIDGRVR